MSTMNLCSVELNKAILNKAIGIINFTKLFKDFIADTMIMISKFHVGLNILCAKDFLNQSFMVTKFIN